MSDANALYQPRGYVVLNGIRAELLQYTLTRNAHGTLDSIKFGMPIKGNPDWSTVLEVPDDEHVIVELYAGYGSQMSRRFVGILDKDNPSFHQGIVRMTGRSLGALFVKNKVTTLIREQTSLDFIYDQCNLLGLNVNVNLRPGQNPAAIREVFQSAIVTGLRNMKVWDIFVLCAQVDDVDVWVSDDALNYCAPELISRGTMDIKWDRDTMTFEGEHDREFSKNLAVEVVTINPKHRVSTTTRWETDADGNPQNVAIRTTVSDSTSDYGSVGSTSNGTSIGVDGGITHNATRSTSQGGRFPSGKIGAIADSSKDLYPLYLPNLTPAEVDRRAVAYLNQLLRYTFTVSFSYAMTPERLDNADITTLYNIAGLPYAGYNTETGSSSIVSGAIVRDRGSKYYPRHTTESFGTSESSKAGGNAEGWTLSVDAVNHSLPRGEV